MNTKAILLLSAAGLLVACGGSSAINPITPPPIVSAPPPIVSAPTAVREVALIDETDIVSISAQLAAAQKGDYFDIPASTLDIEDLSGGNFRFVFVDNLAENKKLFYVIDTENNGGRALVAGTSISDRLPRDNSIPLEFSNVVYTEVDSMPERNIYTEVARSDDGYYNLYVYFDDEDDFSDAEIYKFDYQGEPFFAGGAIASSSDFARPNGEFTYGGRSAVQWGDAKQLAIGDVEMTAVFGNNISTARIEARNLSGDGTTAAFSGNVLIDNVSGTYASTSASITTNSMTVDAGILGVFNGDATLTSGIVFDAQTAGDETAGVFSMSRN